MSQQKQTYATKRLGVGDMILVKQGHPATVSINKEGGAYSAHAIFTSSPTPSLRADSEWLALTPDGTSDEVNVAVPSEATAVACRVTAIVGEVTPRAGARMEVNLTSGLDLLGFNHRKRPASGRQFPDFSVAPPPPDPAGVQPLHWYDATRPETVWQDVDGTIPAVNGLAVARVDDLGSDPAPLTRVDADTRPLYRTAVLNGLNVLAFLPNTFGSRLDNTTDAAAHAVSSLGLSMAIVWRSLESGKVAGIIGQWSNHWISQQTTTLLQGTMLPNASNQTIGTWSQDNWYNIFQSIGVDDGEDYRFRSPGPEFATPLVNGNDNAAGSTIAWRMGSGAGPECESAELIFWPRNLTAPERAKFYAQMDAKYGTMPHT